MNRIYAITISTCLALAAAMASAAPVAAGPDKIAVYAGTWKTATEHFATPFSKAGRETATLRNHCWRSADFYACDQFVNGQSRALIVFVYDAKHDLYHSYAIPAESGRVFAGTLIIKGNRWTYPNEYTDHGKTVYFRTVNVFNGPDSIEFRQEFSGDKVHWTVMAQGHETKIQQPHHKK